MTPEYREQLRNDDWSEDEINNLERIRMRHAAIDKENAYWDEQHKKDGEEWSKKRKTEREERERLGIKPTFKILYSSPDKIDPNSMNPSQRRAYEMRGLSTEELLSQGYIDTDDLNYSENNQEDDTPTSYIPENPTPEIPF